MTEREKMIELLEEADQVAQAKGITDYKDAIADNADHLLANGVIVPPCKSGDTVYYLTTVDTEKELNVTDIFCGTVQGIGFDGKILWISAKYTNGLYYYHQSEDFGKTVFLTKEEAEAKLKERSEGK